MFWLFDMECNIKVCLNSELLKIFFLKSGFGGPHTTTLPWVIPLRVSPCNTRILKIRELRNEEPTGSCWSIICRPTKSRFRKGESFWLHGFESKNILKHLLGDWLPFKFIRYTESLHHGIEDGENCHEHCHVSVLRHLWKNKCRNQCNLINAATE